MINYIKKYRDAKKAKYKTYKLETISEGVTIIEDFPIPQHYAGPDAKGKTKYGFELLKVGDAVRFLDTDHRQKGKFVSSAKQYGNTYNKAFTRRYSAATKTLIIWRTK